jgi:PhzF family phenazine biosynthesis protein
MKIPLYQVDAFTTRPFGGNPAAICPLQRWLPDASLQAIAAENNLAETAYYIPNANGYDLRWFTPTVEVDLCGHATLAAAYVIWTIRRESSAPRASNPKAASWRSTTRTTATCSIFRRVHRTNAGLIREW